MSDALSRFDWELDLLGPAGPPSSTTLLVLLVIGSHVKRRGSVQCWPGISTLERETRLSRPAVINNINHAVELGWLRKETGQTGNMKRRGSIYTLTMPTGKRALPVCDVSTGKRALPVKDSGPVNLTQPTGKPDDVQPVNLTRSPSILEVKEKYKDLEVEDTNVKSNVKGTDKYRVEEVEEKDHGKSDFNVNGVLQEKIKTPVQIWAESKGIYRHALEAEVDYNRRITGLWVLAKRAVV